MIAVQCASCAPRASAALRRAGRSSKASTSRRSASTGGLIDVHHHILPPEYRFAPGLVYDSPGNISRPWTPEMSLEDMDKGGVETAITSMSSPNVWFGDNALRTRLARVCNEYAATMARDHPGRFGLFASLPMPDVDASLREIEHAFDVLGADGAVFLTSLNGKYPGDPVFTPVLEELNRRKAVVYTHPTVIDACKGLLPGVPAAVVEFGADTTRAIASLVFSGAASRFPDIRFIFSHAGGTMPFIVERFTRLARRKDLAAKLPRGVLHELKKFHYEVAQAAHAGALSSLTELVPVRQIMFGTDYPYRSAADIRRGLRKSGVGADALPAIHRSNALRLFPKFSRARPS
jgi:predicted TIM-barrel fold metal-dependent hydrolase